MCGADWDRGGAQCGAEEPGLWMNFFLMDFIQGTHWGLFESFLLLNLPRVGVPLVPRVWGVLTGPTGGRLRG